ncbi:MAG: hypothetical protein HZA54_01085 [Planctomycetes bacterium]|nr:hypothetical protein [Planctomycetota bacterium]
MGYLKETGQLTPEKRRQFAAAILTGYQRLLTFECSGGGFDWFCGGRGKPLLTAYGLLEFTDMARVMDVGRGVIERTAGWLARQQHADGSFPVDGCPHEWGGEAGSADGGVAATAYVAWALQEAGANGPAVERARGWLAARAGSVRDPYALALLANAQVAGDPQGRAAATRAALGALAGAAVRDGDLAHWTAGMRGFTWSEGSSASVEATALATYALLRTGWDPALASGALEWLAHRRDGSGAWGSTSATILAIRCLLEDARAAGGRGAAVRGRTTLRASVNGGPAQTLVFEEGKSDYLQQVAFRDGVRPEANRLELEAAGGAALGWQAVARAYRPRTPAPEATLHTRVESVDRAAAVAAPSDGALDLAVGYDRTRLAVGECVRQSATLRYRGERPTFMVLVELGLPPGFEPETADLAALVAGKAIEKFAVTGRQVQLYVGEVAPGVPVELSYRLRARFPVRATVPPSVAYEYYTPSRRAEAGGGPARLEVVEAR